RAQARIAQDWLYYFGGLADKIEGTVIPLDRQSIFNYTLREPLGVVGVITPWNSPTFIAIMSLAPALAAGNTIVLKPSEITSASAIELARLAEGAGIPPGVINVVCGVGEAGEALADHPLVVKRAQQITIGDPLKAATQMGPVATKMQLEKDESMVARAVAEGAKVLTGGARPTLAEFPDGYFYQPTIVHQLTKDNFLMRNEVF